MNRVCRSFGGVRRKHFGIVLTAGHKQPRRVFAPCYIMLRMRLSFWFHLISRDSELKCKPETVNLARTQNAKP